MMRIRPAQKRGTNDEGEGYKRDEDQGKNLILTPAITKLQLKCVYTSQDFSARLNLRATVVP